MIELFFVAHPFTVTTLRACSALLLLLVMELAERIGLARMAMFCISLLSLVFTCCSCWLLLLTIMLWVLELFLCAGELERRPGERVRALFGLLCRIDELPGISLLLVWKSMSSYSSCSS